MGTHPSLRRSVLVVDDEEDVADAYAMQVAAEYDTEVAYGGEEALAKVDDGVAAVLLDRRMPDRHGDEVLNEIRERGHDCVVIMVTAVDPELNILEMEFDDYLCKPVDGETLLSTLDRHLDDPVSGDPRLEEFFQLLSKLTVLESERPVETLESDEEFRRLKRRATELGGELGESVEDFEEIVEAHRAVSRGSDRAP